MTCTLFSEFSQKELVRVVKSDANVESRQCNAEVSIAQSN